jgi:uncharacterized protein (TIGR00369 family)
MKKTIKNAFAQELKQEEYQCFGCSPHNEHGLKLRFTDTGENEIESIWKPEAHFEGFFKILHGGIQATLHDETAAWLVFTKCKTSGVTQSLCVNYIKHVFVTDEKIRIIARLITLKEKLAVINTKLYNSANELCSEAEVNYFIFPEAVARRKFRYPGAEAFYENE